MTEFTAAQRTHAVDDRSVGLASEFVIIGLLFCITKDKTVLIIVWDKLRLGDTVSIGLLQSNMNAIASKNDNELFQVPTYVYITLP